MAQALLIDSGKSWFAPHYLPYRTIPVAYCVDVSMYLVWSALIALPFRSPSLYGSNQQESAKDGRPHLSFTTCRSCYPPHSHRVSSFPHGKVISFRSARAFSRGYSAQNPSDAASFRVGRHVDPRLLAPETFAPNRRVRDSRIQRGADSARNTGQPGMVHRLARHSRCLDGGEEQSYMAPRHAPGPSSMKRPCEYAKQSIPTYCMLTKRAGRPLLPQLGVHLPRYLHNLRPL